MKRDPRAARRHAAVLVVLAAVLWWHAWMPLVMLVTFVGWAILHTRFQGARREVFMRFRSRVWPPPTLVLVALMVAGTAIYGLSDAVIEARILPIALSVIALAQLAVGGMRAVAERVPSAAARRLDDLAMKGGPA